jgi:hypothetical protein
MKIKVGDIFEITLGNGKAAYAQALVEPEFSFFELSPINYPTEKTLFRLWVHNQAVKQWNKVGNKEPSGEFKSEIARFKQDPINGQLSIYIGGQETPAKFEQVRNLECAAVWESPHINDRLLDVYTGRPNKWVESMRPKPIG